MKLLRNICTHLIIGLNIFILFFLLFENRLVIPGFLKVFGRMHPLLLHFPIVLIIMAGLLEWFRKFITMQEETGRKIVRMVLFPGAFTAALTVVCGLILSKEEGYAGEALTWHKWTGVGVSLLAALLLWYYESGRLKTPVMRSGIIIMFLILLTAGHLGASLTHGEHFLLEPLFGTRDRPADPEKALVFNDLVRPVLEEKCFSCHNPDKAKGRLVLTDTVRIQEGGESGPLFMAGNPDESLLIERLLLDVEHEDHMPPKGKPQLSEEELGILTAWVASGGEFHRRLADLPPGDTLLALAESLHGSGGKDTYDFNAASRALVRQLNTSYRVITPVALESPALNVSFFGRDAFTGKSLEELGQIREQVVSLNLSGMPVGDQDMDRIAGLFNLRKLNLNYTEVTDQGLEKLAGLPHLHSIMLTGTEVSTGSLQKLAKLPAIQTVFAWNTGITAEQAGKITGQNPGLKIETGSYDHDGELLPLNKPVIAPEQAFFTGSFKLKLSHPIQGVELRYTLDGSEPDSIHAPLYKKPIRITENTRVKARAYKKGWLGSKEAETRFYRSSVRPSGAGLVHLPAREFKARGARTLFDMAGGSMAVQDGKWVGYRDSDLVAVVSFTGPVQLKEVALSVLEKPGAQYFPPEVIEIWGGPDSLNLERIGKIQPEMPAGMQDPRGTVHYCPVNGRDIRYLKVVARPVRKLPAWHPAKGQPAWLFTDEILLN